MSFRTILLVSSIATLSAIAQDTKPKPSLDDSTKFALRSIELKSASVAIAKANAERAADLPYEKQQAVLDAQFLQIMTDAFKKLGLDLNQWEMDQGNFDLHEKLKPQAQKPPAPASVQPAEKTDKK